MSDPVGARSLPASRAFVLQLAADADPGRGAMLGRVEHVLSARAAHFDTLDELMRFITRVVAEQASTEPESGRCPTDIA